MRRPADAVTGPLMFGHATTFYDGPFSVESAYRMIADYRVTNLAGAPTAFRFMMAAGDEAAKVIKGQLRVVSSAGEPLNPEVIQAARSSASSCATRRGATAPESHRP